MLHLYVDPIHGDDWASYNMNPHLGTTWDIEFNGPSPNTNLQYNRSIPPADVHPANGPILGNLIHGPYPFKTITGTYGVLGYITGRLLPLSPVGKLPLPIHASNNKDYTITDIIVHCLPGLYGPTGVPGKLDTDADSGLTFNGEFFPIIMIPNVSIQGTSALDTIFDARQADLGRSPVVLFDAPVGVANLFSRTFLDSVTIRNHIMVNTTSEVHLGDGSGAGIFIRGEGQCSPTISNNFIVSNAVGIAIETDTALIGSPPLHSPVIVNNTIARNFLYQIWSGDRSPSIVTTTLTGNLNFGRATPLIYDNVIDSQDVRVPVYPPASPVTFAGLHWDDMVVSAYYKPVGGVPTRFPITPLPGQEFNAYQAATVWSEVLTASNYLTRYFIVPSSMTWPVPAIQPPSSFTIPGTTITVPGRTGSPIRSPAFQPRVDIGALMLSMKHPVNPLVPVGTLYVADVFRDYLDLLALPRSQHDFRLSPMVRKYNATSSIPNPLIGMGINISLDGSPNSAGVIIAGFEFGQPSFTPPVRQIFSPQGILPDNLDYPSAAKHEWDNDAEGFGNNRIMVYPPINPATIYGDIDLGADEVDELIMSGYLNGTRIFSRSHTIGTVGVGLLLRCENPYYFGVTGLTHLRPNYTFWEGLVSEWYRHIEYPGLTAVDWMWQHNGTVNLTSTARWTTTFTGGTNGSAYRFNIVINKNDPGVPRSQWCDFATLLLPDPKPWGITMIHKAPNQLGLWDNYCIQPWYNNLDKNPVSMFARDDNQDTYWHAYNPSSPNPANNTWGIQYSQPFASIVSPPGTMENDVTRTGQTPPSWIPSNWVNSHLWLDPPFTTHLFVNDARFGHWSSPTASTAFDSWGAGDSGNGGTTVDVVPYVLQRPWYGLRINCESSKNGDTTDKRTNLQTFLIVQGGEESQQSKSSHEHPTVALPIPDASKAGVARQHLTDYMKSDKLRKALADRKARIDAMRKGGK